jgi:2,6-dihydroxypyridine 3-monooxygenase
LRAAIVGGSLGGLTAALLLRDLGIEVEVYERSPAELVQRGAGIGFLPDARRYLVERAGANLSQISVSTSHIRYLNRRGEIIYDGEHRYHFSSWYTVYRQMLARMDRAHYHLGHEMSGWVDGEGGVELQFTKQAARQVDLLVCADGVGSTARARLLPQAQPGYAGYVAWRGMVPEAALDPEVRAVVSDAISYYVGANSLMLVYPIPGADDAVEPGERLINWVWYRNYLAGGDLDDLLTDRSGQRRETSLPPGAVSEHHLLELRAGAQARLPDSFARIVRGTAQPFLQVIYDLDIPRMAFGRVCLIGDAAFVARPHAAAGTAKAAADAWALSEALQRHGGNVRAALADWELGQLALGRQLLERTRRIGRRSQFDGNLVPGDPELIFGLRAPGA